MKVLIVDDSEICLKMIETIVRRFGYYTLTALNGKDGMLKVEQNEPDLIILDVLMPVMNGYEFLEELNKKHSRIPVIICSGLSDKKDIMRAKKINKNVEYLSKPCNPIDLQLKIASILVCSCDKQYTF